MFGACCASCFVRQWGTVCIMYLIRLPLPLLLLLLDTSGWFWVDDSADAVAAPPKRLFNGLGRRWKTHQQKPHDDGRGWCRFWWIATTTDHRPYCSIAILRVACGLMTIYRELFLHFTISHHSCASRAYSNRPTAGWLTATFIILFPREIRMHIRWTIATCSKCAAQKWTTHHIEMGQSRRMNNKS